MKRNILAIVLISMVGIVPIASAQNNGGVGIFANYFRHGSEPPVNMWGLGGRLSFNVHENVQLEAEMAYDFNRAFTEGFLDTTTTIATLSFQRSHLRVLHGLFGPKFQTGGGPIRAFVTLKGGFINFRFDDRPATFGTFASTVDELRLSDVSGVLYPGGGVEFYAWIFGLRLDVGDEIYFRDGARNNLRISFGPHIRF